MKNTFVWIIGAGIILVSAVIIIWFFFLRPTQTLTPVATSGQGPFGVAGNVPTNTTTNTGTSNTQQNEPVALPINTAQRVFKISDGPVTGAAFIQTSLPTTTLARYILQENGHVMDQPLDVPGAVARSASNTTIPGTSRALWAQKGGVAYLQYLNGSTIKTIMLIFPAASTTSVVNIKPVEIKFLPDNIAELALSPDSKQIAYLLTTSAGSDGYIANFDGTNSKKLFTVGLSQIILSWPAQNTLLLTTKSSAAAPGAVFSVDVKTGGMVPLVYGIGLTAIADPLMRGLIYQLVTGTTRSTYFHDIKKGGDVALTFNPIPEKCAWGKTATTTLYCGAPLQYADANYLDAWHLGTASLSDTIVSFIPALNQDSVVVAVPGSADGGVQSDIGEIVVSPDDKYLLFVKKGDRSLWAVRLGQN